MTVIVNGRERTLPEGGTIATLLGSLGIDRDGVAVAVDRRVIPRSEHAGTVLPDGARVEVIRAVGGG